MTHTSTEQAEAYEDGAWYWVEKEGWIGDPPTIAPAKYKANCDAWYSFEFSGVPTREVKVLEQCTRANTVARTPMSVVYPEGYGNPFAMIAFRDGWNASTRAHGITQEKQGEPKS